MDFPRENVSDGSKTRCPPPKPSKCLVKKTEKVLDTVKQCSVAMMMLTEDEQILMHKLLRLEKEKKSQRLTGVDSAKIGTSGDNSQTFQSNQNARWYPGRQPFMNRLTFSYQNQNQKKNNLLIDQPTTEVYNGNNSFANIANKTVGQPKNKNKAPSNNLNQIYPELVLKKNIEVKISHVNSLCDFYVTKYADEPELISIQRNLYNSMVSCSQPYTERHLFSGKMGACQVDGLWYRAVVSNISELKEAEIFLIDRGDHLRVNLRSVTVCPKIFRIRDPLAYHCSLNLCLKPNYNDEWTTNLKLKLSNLHMTSAPTYKLAVNASSVENGLHSVTLINGYFCDYGSALKKLSFAHDFPMNATDNTNEENYAGRNNWNSPYSVNNLKSITTDSTIDLVNDPKDVFKDSAERLRIHLLKSTKFRVYQSSLTDYCFYIVPLENHLAEVEEKMALALESTEAREKFIPEVDDIVGVMGPEGKLERAKIVNVGVDKKEFKTVYLDMPICAICDIKLGVKLPEEIKGIQPIGFWVNMDKVSHLSLLSADVKKFSQYLTSNVFVLTDVQNNYETVEYPFVTMRISDDEEQMTTDDLLKSLQYWRFELLLSIGYSTDDDFMDDDKKNDFRQQFPTGERGNQKDHEVLKTKMERFYTVVQPSPVELNVGEYVAVHIADDQMGCTRKWHRSVVEPGNSLKCIDHLEQWEFSTDTSKMIVRRLHSAFLKIAPPY